MAEFYFAWTDPTEEFDPGIHAREDEEVISFKLEHTEGEIPSLAIEVRNPHIGLLAPGRKRWAYLSVLMDGASAIVPLFFGRLVGIPTNLIGEKITLQFIARPEGYPDLKQEIAETMKVAPFFDPVFIDQSHIDDPDTILEAYPVRWHVDRVSLDVTTSDIAHGEDGTEVFVESEVPFNSVKTSLEGAPIRRVEVTADVKWDQSTPQQILPIAAGVLSSYAAGNMVGDWPKAGQSIGGGWTVAPGSAAIEPFGIENTETWEASSQYNNPEKEHNDGDTLSVSENLSTPLLAAPAATYELIKEMFPGILDPFSVPDPVQIDGHSKTEDLIVPLWQIIYRLVLAADPKRARTETLKVILDADIQDIITEPTSQQPDFETINLSGNDVGVEMIVSTIEGSVVEGPPIGNPGRRSYFPTDRGRQSIEYMLMLARAHILFKARSIHVEWNCFPARLFDMSCRKNATINDHRLPGGQASGKVIKYGLSLDGNNGLFMGSITIASCVGNGGSLVPAAGSPVYVENGYVAEPYQFYAGAQTIINPPGDVIYGPPEDPVNDDGLVFPLTASQVVEYARWHGSLAEQIGIINERATFAKAAAQLGESQDPNDKIKADIYSKFTVEDGLKDHAIWLELQMKDITTGFDAGFDVAADLIVPKQINLAALSTP